MSMKNSNDAIGKRIRELPACSTVPQPTAPPRAPHLTTSISKSSYKILSCLGFGERAVYTNVGRSFGTKQGCTWQDRKLAESFQYNIRSKEVFETTGPISSCQTVYVNDQHLTVTGQQSFKQVNILLNPGPTPSYGSRCGSLEFGQMFGM
jgi:hypothetical protein